jgi:hypothetical protein
MGSSSILPDDRQAKTGAEATPADPCRRRLPVWRTSRNPLGMKITQVPTPEPTLVGRRIQIFYRGMSRSAPTYKG